MTKHNVFAKAKKSKVLLASLAGSFLAAGLLGSTAANATAGDSDQPAVASYQSQIKNDGTTVFYPETITADTPVALLLQGGKVHRQHYAQYAEEVASYGFIVVTPNHKRLNFVDTDYYTSTSQIGETLDWMKAEDKNPASPLKGKIDEEKLVLLGHSFGGATGLSISESKCSIPFCTGLTFKLPSQVKAASFYGANNTILGLNPTINNKIPVQLVQGAADGTASPSEGQATYNKLKNGAKQHVLLSGANHYGITNTQNPSGAKAETSTQTLTQDQSIETAARWAAQFLKAQLGDTQAKSFIAGAGDAADDLVVTQSSGL